MSDPRQRTDHATLCEPGPDGTCQLCGDVAVRALVLTVDAAANEASVEMEGRASIVAIDLVDQVCAGDVLLVHQGFAIQRVEPDHERA
jgi:hydrogenase maturation factor